MSTDEDLYYDAMEEVELWRDRYYKLRGLIQEVSTRVEVNKAMLALNIAGVAQVKNQARARLAQDLTRELLLKGAFALVEQDLAPAMHLTLSCSALVILDRKALVNFIREVGDNPAEDHHGEDEPR